MTEEGGAVKGSEKLTHTHQLRRKSETSPSRMELPQPPSLKGGSAVPWYYRVRNAINAAAPFLVPTQTTNLALLVSAILKTRTLCLSELARAYPTPKERRVAAPQTLLAAPTQAPVALQR